MLSFRFSTFAGFVLLCLTSCQPMKSNPGSSSDSNTPQDTSSGQDPGGLRALKYFGYYASQMDGIGRDEDFELLSKSSNLVHILSGQLESKLALTRLYSMKAMVDVHPYLFDASFNLRSDYVESFRQVESLLNSYQDIIVAFYLIDEPYIAADKNGIPQETMKANINLVAKFLRSKYPSVAIATIFDATTIKREWPLPEELDWYGFDCYTGFYYCGGGLRSIPTFFELLKKQVNAFIAKDQRKRILMAVPPSAYNSTWSDKEQRVLDQVDLYKQMIEKDPMFEVVMPFIFQTFTEGDHQWIGTRDVPEVLRKFQEYYRQVIR